MQKENNKSVFKGLFVKSGIIHNKLNARPEFQPLVS